MNFFSIFKFKFVCFLVWGFLGRRIGVFRGGLFVCGCEVGGCWGVLRGLVVGRGI